jgi:DNA-binding transcriptional LysR family regulator
MDLKQLRYFVAVAERGSINAAAQVLHVAQSAVSRQMQNLEAEVGGLLFDRSVSGAAINESGQRLLERARFILGEVESARKDISALSRDVRGTVRLAAPSSIGHLMYVPVIQAMSAQYPQVQLQLTESSTEEVLRGLAAGALDFGIVTAPGDHPLLEFAPLFAEPALLVCRRDDPLARRRRIWRPRQESNPYLALRRRSFYPLNYGGVGKPYSICSAAAWPLPGP